jgi:DNA-binding transcriptional LysR family regulator
MKDIKYNQLAHLTSFCHTVQTGSISKAAQRLGLSQPSVSLQIQNLEKEMSALLFERRGPKISLTPDGEILYQIALPLVEGFENLTAAMHAKRNNVNSGEINIAAGESSALYLLPKYLAQFSEHYPGVKIRVHEGGGLAGINLLREGTVDLALGSFRTAPPDDMIHAPTFSFPQVLITSKDHPLAKQSKLSDISITDLLPYKFIMPARHLNTYGMLERAFAEQNVRPNVVLEGIGWAMIKRCVMANVGIAIVSSVCLQNDKNALHQIPLQAFPVRAYGVILRRGKVLSPQAKALLEMIDPVLAATR